MFERPDHMTMIISSWARCTRIKQVDEPHKLAKVTIRRTDARRLLLLLYGFHLKCFSSLRSCGPRSVVVDLVVVVVVVVVGCLRRFPRFTMRQVRSPRALLLSSMGTSPRRP